MRKIFQTIRPLVLAAPVLYASGLLVLLLLRSAGAERVWWVALANIFALYLLAPLVLLGPLALFVRAWPLRGAAALLLVLFMFQFGAQLVPPIATTATAQGARLRVMTINLHFAATEQAIASLLAAIRAQNADIVALQELSPAAATTIVRELSASYPYQVLRPSSTYTGMGVLSRFPLVAPLQAPKVAGQWLELELPGTRATLINASLRAPEFKWRRMPGLRTVKVLRAYSPGKRTREIDTLLKKIAAAPGPVLLLGDFNLSDREPDYTRLASQLQDAFRSTSAGFGFTYPKQAQLGSVTLPFPLIRIDYIWSNAGFAPAAAHVACDTGWSDHCAVVADLRSAE